MGFELWIVQLLPPNLNHYANSSRLMKLRFLGYFAYSHKNKNKNFYNFEINDFHGLLFFLHRFAQSNFVSGVIKYN